MRRVSLSHTHSRRHFIIHGKAPFE